MSTVEEQPQMMSEDAIIAYVHGKRQFIVDKLLENGLPKDIDETRIVLSALKDMDSTAVARKRIKVDEKSNSNQEETNNIIGGLLQQIGKRRPFVVENGADRPPPALATNIPEPITVPGEMSEVTFQPALLAVQTEDSE